MDNPSRREAMEIAAVGTLALVARGVSLAEEPVPRNRQEGTMTALDQKTQQELIKRAKSAAERAYSPYSKFRVGAAVLTESGEIFSGCNVENASYGLTICAERNAVFQMVSQGKQRIKAVVVYTPTPTPATSCGACRQVINEFGPEAHVMSVCDGPDRIDTTLDKLLPRAFGPKNLE
jgi:cytidine deaminase